MGRERRYDMRERLGLTAAGAGVGTPWDRAGKEERDDLYLRLLQNPPFPSPPLRE